MATPPTPRPGRNDKCWCGSGKKYKHCCLDKDEAAARAASTAAPPETEAAAQATENAPAPRQPKHQTYQPWKKSAANTHGFQRVSTPRKVGGG